MQKNAHSARQELIGTFGAVSSTHWIATQIGMNILEKGGNAFDAAVAVAFALQVAEPHQNSLGGEAVILFLSGGEAAPTVVCGQGVAPAKATIRHFNSLGLDVVPWNGLLPAVVPGAFDAWMLMFRDYGTLSLETILAPAIAYAKHGVPLAADACRRIAKAMPLFREHWRSSAEIYLPGNSVPEAGELFCNRDLASTYERILREAESVGGERTTQIEKARSVFYRGFIADRISEFFRRSEILDSSGTAHKGVLDLDDMMTWEATYEPAPSVEFRGFQVFKSGAWTQGPAFLQFLELADAMSIVDLDPLGPEYVHRLIEAFKLVYADREAWCGDADNSPRLSVPSLLEKQYLQQRCKLISSEASMDLRAGVVAGQTPRLPQLQFNISGGMSEEWQRLVPAEPRGAGDTCHVDVIDRWGNVVAATPSGGWLHGSPVVPGLGFSLSTRGQMFWLQAGLASSLIPRTRPRTTLSPTIALRDEHVLAFGTRGADYQDQWIAQFFLYHVGRGMDLQEAWDAPNFHSDHWPRSDFPRDASPGKVTLDDRYPEATLAELNRRGHLLKVLPGRRWGYGCAAKKSGAIVRAAASAATTASLALAR